MIALSEWDVRLKHFLITCIVALALSWVYSLLPETALAQAGAPRTNVEFVATSPPDPNAPDLVPTVSGPKKISVNQIGSFTVMVKNDSLIPIPTTETVEFEVEVGPEVKLVDFAPPNGVTCQQAGNKITCTRAGLGAGATISFKIRAQGVKEVDSVRISNFAKPAINETRVGGNTANFVFDVEKPKQVSLTVAFINQRHPYQLSMQGQARLSTGATYSIAREESTSNVVELPFGGGEIQAASNLTKTTITELNLVVTLTASTSVTESDGLTQTFANAFIGFTGVPSSGQAIISGASRSECGMSAYLSPGPAVSAAAGDTPESAEISVQSNADLELECSENGDVSWDRQPNVGFANLYTKLGSQLLVGAAQCGDQACADAPQRIEFSIQIQALPEPDVYLPFVR